MKGTLVLGLVTKEVEVRDIVEYTHTPLWKSSVRCEDKVLEAYEELNLEYRVVPLHRFYTNSNPNIYIAITKEIQEFLGFPMDIFSKQLEEAEARYSAVSRENMVLKKKSRKLLDMSITERIKFLFKGRTYAAAK
jgi:hypothetical protein